MTWPEPRPGLVIRYSSLWVREAELGREEGVKDRPCAIVLVAAGEAGRQQVYVLPVKHARPADPSLGIEIPAATKARLGLDDERSWIVLSEVNSFRWPGPDLRPATSGDLSTVALGFLPPRLFQEVRARFVELDRRRLSVRVDRTE